jgi:uncharacterized membrane protein YdfJ with MMPL/SSD domain
VSDEERLTGRALAFWRWLARNQTRHPLPFVLAFAVLAALGGWRATRLTLVTDFADLLPQNEPSVVELRRLVGRVPGMSRVLVVLEGTAQDGPALRRLADTLCPPLLALGPPFVTDARSGVQEARQFLMPRAGLFLTLAELDDLDRQLSAHERQAFRKRVGADLADAEPAPAPVDASALEAQLVRRAGPVARYPGGYYQAATPEGLAAVVTVTSGVGLGDLGGAQATVNRIKAVVAATIGVAPVRVSFAGDLVTGLAEYDLVRHDVMRVGGLGLFLILGALLLFFRSPRALVALGVTIGAGCALTFGVAQLSLGHLNLATAFLLSVVAGNGINFGIIWLARFLEERWAQQSLAAAVEATLARTYGATLASACAAAAAYGSLALAHFRAFRHFAVIGASGMLLCWIVTVGLLPAVVVLLYARQARPVHTGTHFERPFAWLVARAPRPAVIGGAALAIVAVIAGARYLARGPLEYDMRKLGSAPHRTGEVYRAAHQAAVVMGGGGSPMVVVTDDESEVPAVAAALRQVRDRVPHDLRPFEEVRTLQDLVPPEQAARLARLAPLARRLRRARDRGAIDDRTWARLEPLLPPPGLRPFTIRDLPDQLRRPFTEKDGTLGHILYVQPTVGQPDSDLHYLLRWADAYRQTRLPDGRVVNGSGRAVIFADLLRASLLEMPRTSVLSFAMTALMVVLLFRRARAVAAVLGSLALAVVWMLGALGLSDTRLNFINFIALPITFGVGVDYAVNVYSRYQLEGPAGVLVAVRGTGGAVVLCSLTTSLGYLALLEASNLAVRSLGAVAVTGEVCCLLTALLVMPAVLAQRSSSRRS